MPFSQLASSVPAQAAVTVDERAGRKTKLSPEMTGAKMKVDISEKGSVGLAQSQ